MPLRKWCLFTIHYSFVLSPVLSNYRVWLLQSLLNWHECRLINGMLSFHCWEMSIIISDTILRIWNHTQPSLTWVLFLSGLQVRTFLSLAPQDEDIWLVREYEASPQIDTMIFKARSRCLREIQGILSGRTPQKSPPPLSGNSICTSVRIFFCHWNLCKLNLPGRTTCLETPFFLTSKLVVPDRFHCISHHCILSNHICQIDRPLEHSRR